MLQTILRVIAGFLILFVFYLIHFVLVSLLKGSIPEVPFAIYKAASTLTCSLLGGYFTARIAKHGHWKNVIVVAMLTFLYMIANISGIQEGETTFFITSLILMVGGVLLGGYLFVRKQSQ